MDSHPGLGQTGNPKRPKGVYLVFFYFEWNALKIVFMRILKSVSFQFCEFFINLKKKSADAYAGNRIRTSYC